MFESQNVEGMDVSSDNAHQPQQVSNHAQAQAPMVPKNPCMPLTEKFQPFPFFVQEEGFAVSGVTEACVTDAGKPGYTDNSEWLGMTFPCTQTGKYRVKGHSYAPKLITFDFAPGCATAVDLDSANAGATVSERVPGGELSVLNIFGVKFWYFNDEKDAGIGSQLEISSYQSLKKWKKWRRGEVPIHITLIGQEVSWVRSPYAFKVQGQLIPQADYSFKFKVDELVNISKQEFGQYQALCISKTESSECASLL